MKSLLIAVAVVLLALWVWDMATANTQRTGYMTPLSVQHHPTHNPQRTVDSTELQNAPAPGW